ncbi:hypothetical protein WDW37_18795 [Bdellovibrionota bacterium FG-1]
MLKNGMSEVLADAVLELIRAGGNATEEMITSTVHDITGCEARTFAE